MLDNILAAKRGDQAAFEKVLNHFSGHMRRFVASHPHGDAENALQDLTDVFRHCITHMPDHILREEGQSPDGYLFVSLRNAAARLAERDATYTTRFCPQAPEDMPEGEDDGMDPEEESIALETQERTRRAIRELPVDERKVIEARFYQRLTQPETARMLGVALITVRRREEAALGHLRALLADLS